MQQSASFHIDFEPIGRRGISPAHMSLLDSARQLGVELISVCGGQGTCRRCAVQILSGTVSPPTAAELQAIDEHELAGGYRLACRTFPLSDVKVHVPPTSLSAPQRTQVEGLEVSVRQDPPVHAYDVQLAPPSLDDLTADAERVCAALRCQHDVQCRSVDVDVLRDLSPQLRAWGWQACAALRDGELVGVFCQTTPRLGLAYDVGSTKIAGYLVDLSTGRTLVSKGIMNPQISYGEDIISRLNRARLAPMEARRLREMAVEALNSLAAEMCAEVGQTPREVEEAVMVANTAIHHLVLGLPAGQLAMAPYVATVRGALDVKARDVGMALAPGAYVHVLPNIAGYVGADHVAMILATDMWRMDGLVLGLDIGTNTEICLVSDGALCSLSAASGPAFEGAHIKFGMRAAPGSIEHVRLDDGRLEYQTIGDRPPVGICGSGMLDALAQLLQAGVLDRSGRMGQHPRVRDDDGARSFVLVDEQEAARRGVSEILLTQRDVREVQLAKGAIRTGIQILLQTMGRREEEIDRIVIAGAFGTYIDPASAVAIGMLPPVPLDRIMQVGNAAGTGARLALVSVEQRALAQEIARRVRYVELASVPSFARLFARASGLGNE